MKKKMITIWAIMLTGKSGERIQSAKNSLRQMHEMKAAGRGIQYKTLILNQHDSLKVIEGNDEYVREVHIDRNLPHLSTLGGIRNYGLSLIPNGDYIYILDDDDYHHPELLDTLWKVMSGERKRPSMVQLKNRLNFNLTTQGCWQSSHRQGLVHFLGSIDALRAQHFQYHDTNTLEDLSIYAMNDRLLLDNDPKLYVRYTHGDNASVWVDQKQTNAQLNTGLYSESTIEEESVTKEYCIRNCPMKIIL